MKLRLQSIRKTFLEPDGNKRVLVLDDVTFEADASSFIVLLGGSGCGKSTLLRIVAGLETADSGQLWLGDRELSAVPPAERDVAMVFQSYALYPHMTVAQNLRFALSLNRRLANNEIQARVDAVAESLGLTALLERLPKHLSGGQRQRVAIGRALVKRPKLFLFDEPLSNLDANLRSEVRAELKRLHQQHGITTLYVTHDQVEAMSLADRICVLDRGRVAQFATPRELFDVPRSRFVAGFVGQPAMCFLRGQVRDGSFFVGGCRLGSAANAVVEVGVRPTELQLLPPPTDGASSANEFAVHFVEEHGGARLAHGTFAGQTLLVMTDQPVQAGQHFSIGWPERKHFFTSDGVRA